MVPNAASAIDIVVDLRANRVDCTALLAAPSEGRTQTRINWLLRQLKDAPDELLITAATARAKDNGPTHALGALRDNPMLIIENPQADIRSFSLTLSHPGGTKRGQGKGSFVSSVTSLVDRFYVEVLQYLKNWSAPPPRPKQAPPSDAQEVEPPGLTALEQLEAQRKDATQPDNLDGYGGRTESDPRVYLDTEAKAAPFRVPSIDEIDQ
jgi:hypothetical protein